MGDAALRGGGWCPSEDLYVQVRAAEPWSQVRDQRRRSAVKAGRCGRESSDTQRFVDRQFLVFDQEFKFPCLFVCFRWSCFIINLLGNCWAFR